MNPPKCYCGGPWRRSERITEREGELIAMGLLLDALVKEGWKE